MTVSTLAILGDLLPCAFLTQKPLGSALPVWSLELHHGCSSEQWPQPPTSQPFSWLGSSHALTNVRTNVSSPTETALPGTSLSWAHEPMEEGSSVSPAQMAPQLPCLPWYPMSPGHWGDLSATPICKGGGVPGPLDASAHPRKGKSHSPTLASWFLLF